MLENWLRALRHDREQWKKVKTQQPKKVKGLLRRFFCRAEALVGAVGLLVVLILSATVAWFTNISKTSNLVFHTEAWGLDEEKIQVPAEGVPVSVSPGGSGILPLRVDNSGNDRDVRLSVTVSKKGMDTELQKRVYFYVDRAGAPSGSGQAAEAADRVYLSSDPQEAARYTVLGGDKLLLGQDYYNDAPIRWKWVYDMEGYYFRGSLSQSGEGGVEALTKALTDAMRPLTPASGEEIPEAEGLKIEALEYIRPIEYPFDTAEFDMETGLLKTAGGLSAVELLQRVSASDGYAGQIEAAVRIEGKLYYPVSVSLDTDTGTVTGVWAYLCTREEIEEGIRYDNAPEEQTAAVTIEVTAQELPAEKREVRTRQELEQALGDSEINVAVLANDLILEGPIRLEEGYTGVLDLNGYSLHCSGEGSLFTVAKGAGLTLRNGGLFGGDGGTAVTSAGGNTILSQVTVQGFDTAVSADAEAGAGDSRIRILDCVLKTKDSSVVVRGNGSATPGLTQVVIEGSTIQSENGAGVCGVDDAEEAGTSIVLLNSEISGGERGVYHPQQKSTLLMNQCTITGGTGVAVKGGTVTLQNSTIEGSTGCGVLVEAGQPWPATVLLKGNSTVSGASYAVELRGYENAGPGRIAIYGGSYSGTNGAAFWNGIGQFEIHGGAFTGSVADNITRFGSETSG